MMGYADKTVYFITKIENDEVQIQMSKRVKSKTYEVDDMLIKERTALWFQFPYIVMIKGNIELIVYSFQDDQFYYESLNLPIVHLSKRILLKNLS